MTGRYMTTQVLPVTPQVIAQAAALLKRGAVVAFPTETVYGLGANALDGAAVEGIFHAKNRPADNPLIVHVTQVDQVTPLVRAIPEAARRLMEAFWPGPLTIVLEAADIVPEQTRGGLSTVGIRNPSNAAARALIDACGFPLAAPSANRSGRPSPTNADDVYADMAGRIPMILDGGPCAVGVESTVVSLVGGTPRVLRPGFVTAEDIARVCGAADVDNTALHELLPGGAAASPGMKYRHYAPQARVTVVTGEDAAVRGRIAALYDDALSRGGNPAVLCLRGGAGVYGPRTVYDLGGTAQSAAENLFTVLRRLDADGRTDVFAEAIEPVGVGLAVMNRLLRSAGFHTLNA